MKRFLLIGLTALLLCLPAGGWAAEQFTSHPWGESLSCDGTLREAYWLEQWGATSYVKQIQVWAGTAGGQVSDIFFWWWIDAGVNDGKRTLAWTVWDHYVTPTNFHNYTRVFQPDYMKINPGDRMVFQYRCTVFSGPTGSSLTPILWYSTAP